MHPSASVSHRAGGPIRLRRFRVMFRVSLSKSKEV